MKGLGAYNTSTRKWMVHDNTYSNVGFLRIREGFGLSQRTESKELEDKNTCRRHECSEMSKLYIGAFATLQYLQL